MEKVESALDVLSRAATMVQPCPAYPASDSDSFETPSAASSGESEGDRTLSPEAPARDLTGKWRRDRRERRLPDYQPRENGKMALRSHSFNERRSTALTAARAPQTHSDGDLSDEVDDTRSDAAHFKSKPSEQPGRGCDNGEAPIDMRLTARAGPPPPPPYALHPRPSVITRGNDAPAPPASMSMCDPVIDEHFRRSLGDNYMTLFKKNADTQPGPKPNTKDRASSPILFSKLADPSRPTKIIAMDVDDASVSVDDHFAKALGDTWRQIQTSRLRDSDDKNKLVAGKGVVDDHFSKALGDTWNKIKTSRLDLSAESSDAKKPAKEPATTKILSRSGVVI